MQEYEEYNNGFKQRLHMGIDPKGRKYSAYSSIYSAASK
jgi:hypothetical protein